MAKGMEVTVNFTRLNRILSTKIYWSGRRFTGAKKRRVPEFMVDALREIGNMIMQGSVVNAIDMCLDTGKLVRSVRKVTKPKMDGDLAYVEVKYGSKYALFVHEGTGIFGPKRSPYTSKSGRPMKIVLKTPRQVENARRKGIANAHRGMVIYTNEVKGQRAKPFLRMSLGIKASGDIDEARINRFYQVFMRKSKM